MIAIIGGKFYYKSKNDEFRSLCFKMDMNKIVDKKDIGFTIRVYKCVAGIYDREYIGDLESFICIYENTDELYEEVIDFFYSAQFKPHYLSLLKALQKYTMRGFGYVKYHTVDDIPNIINLAHTTTESGNTEVQVDFNLEKLQWEDYINRELKIVSKRNSLEGFINELNNCSFEDIVSDILYMAEKEVI